MSNYRKCIYCGKDTNIGSTRSHCGYCGENFMSERSRTHSENQLNTYEGNQGIGGYLVALLKGVVIVAGVGLVAMITMAGFSWTKEYRGKKIGRTYVVSSSANSIKSSQQRTSRYGNTVGNEANQKTDDYYCKYCLLKPSRTDGLTCYSAKNPYLHVWLLSKKTSRSSVASSTGTTATSRQKWSSRYGNTVGNQANQRTDDYYCKYCLLRPSRTDGLTCYRAKDPYLHSWLPIKKTHGTSVTSSSRLVSTSRQKWSSRYGNTVGNELNRKTDDYYCKYCRLKPSLTDGLTCYSAKDPYLHVWLRR